MTLVMSQEQQQENKQKNRIGLIFGGRSGEHEVSLASANAVMANLDKDKYEVIPIGITKTGAWLLGTEPTQLLAAPDAQPDSTQSNQQATTAVTLTGDPNVRRLIPLQNGAQLHDNGALDVIFPVMHGTYGEDGALQGLLEMANVPYVGYRGRQGRLPLRQMYQTQSQPLRTITHTSAFLRHSWRETPRETHRAARETVESSGKPLYRQTDHQAAPTRAYRTREPHRYLRANKAQAPPSQEERQGL
jgi:hypothetical protein